MSDNSYSFPSLFREETVEDPQYIVYLNTDHEKVYGVTEEDVEQQSDYFIVLSERTHSFKSNELIELIMQRNLEKDDIEREVCDQRPILTIVQKGVPEEMKSLYIVYH